MEELFFNNNITTGIQVAHARGVIMLALAQKGLHPVAYTPSQVKQSVVGYGKAGKTAGYGDDQEHARAAKNPASGTMRLTRSRLQSAMGIPARSKLWER